MRCLAWHHAHGAKLAGGFKLKGARLAASVKEPDPTRAKIRLLHEAVNEDTLMRALWPEDINEGFSDADEIYSSITDT